MALIAQMSTLETRIPFLHAFDGFRTSHEVQKIEVLSDDDIRELLPMSMVHAHRERAMTPDNPYTRAMPSPTSSTVPTSRTSILLSNCSISCCKTDAISSLLNFMELSVCDLQV